MATRKVHSYRRSNGQRVRAYSQRYEKGDMREVGLGLALAVGALLLAALHLAVSLMQLAAGLAAVLAGLLLARAEMKRRRKRRPTTRRPVRAYRRRRAPVRSADGRLPRQHEARSGTWVRRDGGWVRVD